MFVHLKFCCSCCELKLHAKLQNPVTIHSGRKVVATICNQAKFLLSRRIPVLQTLYLSWVLEYLAKLTKPNSAAHVESTAANSDEDCSDCLDSLSLQHTKPAFPSHQLEGLLQHHLRGALRGEGGRWPHHDFVISWLQSSLS